jgi:hypothetical protein
MPSEATSAAAAEAAVAAANGDAPVTPRKRRRRHWRKWVVLAVVVLAIRATLPMVVAPFLAARLSRTLGTRVEIADLTFQPIDAILTLRNVTVHAPTGTADQTAPPIVARRVRADVQWLPLLHQRLELRELVLDSARIELDRFADGSFGLANLKPPHPESELPPGWSVELNRIAVHDSQLRIRDLAAERSGVLDVTLHTASVAGIHRRATAFGKAPNLHVDALVGGGHLRVHGRYELRADGLVLDAQMRIKDMPVAQAQAYVADRGWTDLSGQVSGLLRWQREPRRRDVLSGRLVLRHGRVYVGALAEPVLEIRRGRADISAIDLLTRRLAITSLTLRGARLGIRSDANAPIPLLATAWSRPPLEKRRRDEASTAADSSVRWHWMVERFDTPDGRLRLLGTDSPFEMRAQVSGENLGPGAYWSPVRLHARRRAAVAAFDGTARIGDGVVIEGRLTAGGIDVPALSRAAALPWADLVQAGRATADLTLQLDTATADNFARGTISLTDVWIAGPDPSMFALGSTAVDLTLDRYEPRPTPGDDRGKPEPPRIIFSQAEIHAPYVLLTRTAEGWTLPPFVPSTEDGGSIDAVAEPTPVVADTVETAELTFHRVRTTGGNVTVVDLMPAAPVTWDLTRVAGSVERLALPTFAFDNLLLQGSDRGFGQLYLGASRRGGDTQFELSGDNVSLVAVRPYLQLAGLPYSFASGKGAFKATGLITNSRWSAMTGLTLQDATVNGAEALQMTIGMPLASALAVLQDESGAITLQLSLASPLTGRQTLADQVALGIRDTIHGVTEFAATGAHERASLPTLHVLFAAGQTQLTAPAMQEIGPVVELLRSRPGLVVELSAATSPQDRRWLAEQALLPRLQDSGGGLVGMLRALGLPDTRARIRTALAARTRGGMGLLDDDDEAALSRLLADAPPVTEQQLAGLRAVRLAHVVSYLVEQNGIGSGRVLVRGDARDQADRAAVRLQILIGSDVAKSASVVP